MGVIQREMVPMDAGIHDALLPLNQQDVAEFIINLGLLPDKVRTQLVHILEHTPSNKPQHEPCQLLRVLSLSREHPQATLKAGIVSSGPSKILRWSRLGDGGTLPVGTLHGHIMF